MSEEIDNNKLKKSKLPLPKGPKFNFYWVYGLIALGLIALQFFGSDNSSKETTWEKFNQEMLQANDVDKLVVVNKEIVEVYIKPERLDNEV